MLDFHRPSHIYYGNCTCVIEDNGCEDSNQIKLTTFRRREELIMERYDAEGGNSVEDKHDGDEEDKKSITEEAITTVTVAPPVATKPTQSTTEEAVTTIKVGPLVASKPTQATTEEAVTTVKLGPPVAAKPSLLITEEAIAAVKLAPPVAAKPTPSPRNAK